MSALDFVPVSTADAAWADISRRAPELASTMCAYLDQVAVSLAPSSLVVANTTLRLFATYLVDHHRDVSCVAEVGRSEIEGFKIWLRGRVTAKGTQLSANTFRQRLGMVRTFFERIIEWDWADAPLRVPVYATDLPRADEPSPRALDDATAARLWRATAADPDPLRRLVVGLLARTGVRVGELCALEADAVKRSGEGHWLKVPLGKLHNDRFVPLHPQLVTDLAAWSGEHGDGGTGLLLHRNRQPLNRHIVTRILNRVAKAAGIGHVHPHQLRHTLATQAINRGMRLEAVAAMLGHRSLRMTMVYARMADATVASEYHAAADRVDALYAAPAPPTTTSRAMRALQAEHRRMLANGWCTRPAELDCSFESICEGCGFFATSVEFRPTLQRQRDDAEARHQQGRVRVLDELLERAETAAG